MSAPESTGGPGQPHSQPGNSLIAMPQVARLLPGPAGKLQELAASGALQQATPEILGLRAGSQVSASQLNNISQHNPVFLSRAWADAKAYAAEEEVAFGGSP